MKRLTVALEPRNTQLKQGVNESREQLDKGGMRPGRLVPANLVAIPGGCGSLSTELWS